MTEKQKKVAARNEEIYRKRLVASGTVFVTKSRDFIFSRMDTKMGDRYFKEILHSIFFHCYIYKQSIDPEEILGETLKSELAEMYPDVFESYTSQLPRRPPFSILLEVVVETRPGRNETIVQQELALLNDKMITHISGSRPSGNDFCFGATVVSYSYFERSGPKTQNYFGASMSCKGRITTMIYISVACIETWNDNVAHGVCLADKGHRSITLPVKVWSRAYHLRHDGERGNYRHRYDAVSPCSLCQEIFPNAEFSPPASAPASPPEKRWPYGNCAECEAISNLLNGETSVSEETQELNTNLEKPLMTLREEREGQLSEDLEKCNFNVNPADRFYNP